MRKYELCKDTFGLTTDFENLSCEDIFYCYWDDTFVESEKISFDSLEEALAAFEKEKANCHTRKIGNNISGNLIFLEENEYDEEGDLVAVFDVIKTYAEGLGKYKE